MERAAATPRISWTGPQPASEADAYLLAKVLRIVSPNTELMGEERQDQLMYASILTTRNLHAVATLYAFYKAHSPEANVMGTRGRLQLIKASAEESLATWAPKNSATISEAAKELLEYVETPKTRGFRAFD